MLMYIPNVTLRIFIEFNPYFLLPENKDMFFPDI